CSLDFKRRRMTCWRPTCRGSGEPTRTLRARCARSWTMCAPPATRLCASTPSDSTAWIWRRSSGRCPVSGVRMHSKRSLAPVTRPGRGGETPDVVLAAARLAGVDRVFRIGGAQAIAALAYGTRTIPRVDKIVGPGNRFVTEAKRQVAGEVGIDMMAGPTEVLIIADGHADVRFIAADMIAQAEHDEDACAWCVTTSTVLADALDNELARQVARAPRKTIVERSLAAHGVVVVVPDLDSAVEVANRRAPEHLEVLTRDPWPVARRIRHAGASFGGASTPEPVAYLARRPATAERTFGLLRLEILAALVNGAALLAISIGVAIEALHRLRDPAPVQGALLAAVAGLGLVANVAGATLLHRGHNHS